MAPRRRRNDGRAQRSSPPPRQPERNPPHRHPAPPPPLMPPRSLHPDDATLRTSPPPPPPMPPGRHESTPAFRLSDLRTRPLPRSMPQRTPSQGNTTSAAASKADQSAPPMPRPVTPPNPIPEEFLDELFNGAAAKRKLQMSQVFKVPDLEALKLDITLLASSCISTLVPSGLMIKYFVRVDNDGIFHTYPDRGGPFKSIQEVQEAIDSYHVIQRKNVCMDGLSDEERAVRLALYWHHNGTRKHSAEAARTTNFSITQLVKALLDKYNEDSGLVGDLAYELEDIVSHNSCFDGEDCIYSSYYHFNLTIKTKGADANNDMYFAEVTCMDGDRSYEAYVLTCICMVKPDDNGECHVCGPDMKHPTHVGFNHGRPQMSRGRCYNYKFGVALFEKLLAVHDEAWLKEEEARVRHMIKEGLKAEEGSRKLEVNNKRDDHGKKDKYVVPAKRTIIS